MQIIRRTIKEKSSKVIYWKFNKSTEESNNGSKAVIIIVITIIMPDAIIMYLNFNENTPIITI
jgi:hypothetical protein